MHTGQHPSLVVDEFVDATDGFAYLVRLVLNIGDGDRAVEIERAWVKLVELKLICHNVQCILTLVKALNLFVEGKRRFQMSKLFFPTCLVDN